MSPSADLATVDPRELSPSRIALHHAALLVSSVGRSFGERQPGSRHAALFWDSAMRGLAGVEVPAPAGPFRAALHFGLPAIVLGRGPAVPLDRLTVAEARDAIAAVLTAAGLDATGFRVRTPADLPPGPMQTGAAFAVDPVAAAALGRWFALADERLAEIATAHRVPLPVPCWPDHFDLSVVVPLPAPAPDGAQVGLGFSPGDTTIAEPYFYVTPWPLSPSRAAEVPAPSGGHWQVEGWTGLALPATAVASAADPDEVIAAFLERGFEIGRDLVLAA